MNTTDPWTLAIIIGLTVVSVVSRCFFFISSKPWHLPDWLQRGLQYAPIAALSAVIVPEIVMTQGQLISSWQDAKLLAALAGIAYYFWRRGVLGTIVAGMAVYLPLHLGLGW
jgi:branched-subunit amino acid transport protein